MLVKRYFRLMLGQKSVYASEAFQNNYIGIGFFPDTDLSSELVENWRDFNKKFIPLFLAQNPQRTKVAAGLACGMLHTVIKGIQIGDIVICPDGKGAYHVAEVVGNYEFHSGQNLPHRRPVKWYPNVIYRSEMSDTLRNSTGAIGTISEITKHSLELEKLISGQSEQTLISTDETVEDPSIFALEKHLEDFLIQNWQHTEFGKIYDIYQEEGEPVGQQYPTDTGPIDILAISKDKLSLLVVELKKGRIGDVVVGQCLRYMGYVKDELAEPGQTTKGVIIAFEDDLRVRRALSATSNIDFYTYKINFKLEKK